MYETNEIQEDEFVQHCQKAKEWLLSHPDIVQHIGRTAYLTSKLTSDGKEIFVPLRLEQMSRYEMLEDALLQREIWTKMTLHCIPNDWNWQDERSIVEATDGNLKYWLEWAYSEAAHSLLLRWVSAALSTTATNETEANEINEISTNVQKIQL